MELAAARCMVVVWSELAIESRQVRYCAQEGWRRGCLLQVLIDAVSPPPEFQSVPWVDLSVWHGKITDPRLAEIAAGVRRIVGSEGIAQQRELAARARESSHAKQFMALAGSASAEARDHYDRGFTRRLKEDFAGAIADCSKAIEIDPGYAQAYKTRAIAYYQRQEYERAIDDLTKLIEIEPGYFGGLSLRGLARVRCKDYERAIPDFNRAIALETEHAGTYYGRGLANHGIKAYDAAIASYSEAIEKALEVGGVPARYYFYRAQAYEERGLVEDRACAEFDYLRALQAHPPSDGAEEALVRLCGDARFG
jgi:tetratricopeptide (TPR) repeat protein